MSFRKERNELNTSDPELAVHSAEMRLMSS